MRGYLVPGLILAVATGLLVWGGEALGLDLEHVALLGAAIGGAVGLVPDRSPLARAGGLLVGAVAAWLGYLLRAAFLPDSSSGRATAAVLVVVICLFAAFLVSGRLPLWSMLLGAAVIVGAYEEPFTAAPPEFLATSPTAMTTALLAAAFGFLATILLGQEIEDQREREREFDRDDDDSGEITDPDGPTDLDDGPGDPGFDQEKKTFWEGTLR